MEASNPEQEFSLYWPKLTDAQKESVFLVVKNFAEANEKTELVDIPEDVMVAIRKDRADYMNGIGKDYTRAEPVDYLLRNS